MMEVLRDWNKVMNGMLCVSEPQYDPHEEDLREEHYKLMLRRNSLRRELESVEEDLESVREEMDEKNIYWEDSTWD